MRRTLNSGSYSLRDILKYPSSWVLLTVIIMASYIRLWGIDYGLPYRYHIDEQGWVAYGGLLCSGKFDFPAWTAGPNFFHVLLCAADGLLYGSGWLVGWWGSISDFRTFYDADPSLLYLLGRSISALLGTATVLLVYLLGEKLWSRRVGLIAALMLAFNFLHVRDSHYIVSDILGTFVLTACLLFCTMAMKRGGLRYYVLAALTAGIAAGIKNTFVFGLIPVGMVYLLSQGQVWSIRSLISQKTIKVIVTVFVSFLVGFSVGYPNVFKAFVDFTTFSGDLLAMWEGGQIRSALWEIEPFPGWVFYLKVLGWGMGLPLALLALAGIGFSLWQHSRPDIVLLSFWLPFYLFLGSQLYYTAHYLIPVFPILILLAARFLDYQLSALTPDKRWRNWLAGAAMLVFILPSVVAIFRYNSLIMQEDTRTIAKGWIETNIPANARIGTSLYTFWEPPLSSTTNPQPNSSRTYEVVSVGGLGGLSDVSFEAYQEQGIDYLIINSFVYDIPLRDERKQRARRVFFDTLDSRSSLIYMVKPYRGDVKPKFEYDQVYGPWTSLAMFERPGPTIKIYKLPDRQFSSQVN